MSYWVYILHSENANRYYCGQTENLKNRIAQHNDPEYTLTRTTKVFKGPWKLKWSIELQSRTEAIKLERKIKKRGIARYIADYA